MTATRLFATIALASAAVSATPAGEVYWTIPGGFESPPGHVMRADLDGATVEAVITQSSPESLALLPDCDAIFWTEDIVDSVYRSDLAGGNIELLIDFGSEPTELSGLVVDPTAGKLYWIDQFGPDIHSANLDGSNIQRVPLNEPLPSGLSLELDVNDGMLYWGEFSKIRRASVSGGPIQTVYETDDPFVAAGIVVHPEDGLVYWTEIVFGSIQRKNPVGGIPQTLLSGLDQPAGIDLDPLAGKLYWTERGLVRRSDLDGTDVEDLVAFDGQSRDLVLDLDAPDTPAACVPATSTLGTLLLAALVFLIGVKSSPNVAARARR